MGTQLKDQGNIARATYDPATESVKTLLVGGNLVPDRYDEIAMTYITAGNGTGEIGTVTYKYLGSTIATLTLSYDVSNRIINVVRS